MPISQQLQPLHSSLIQPLPCILKDRVVWASPALTQTTRTFYRHSLFSNTVFNVLLKIPPGFLVSKFLNKPFDVKTRPCGFAEKKSSLLVPRKSIFFRKVLPYKGLVFR